MTKFKFLASFLISIFFHFQTTAQCTFVVDEYDNFEYSTTIPGYVSGTTYHPSPSTWGARTGSKGMYMNFVNGLAGNTVVLDRTYDVCVGTDYRFDTWFKEINGGSSTVEVLVIDANGNALVNYQNTFVTGNPWVNWVSPTFTPTTSTIQFQIVYVTGVGNNDFGMDDLTLEICSPTVPSADIHLCASNTPFNLFDSLGTTMNNTGTWAGPSAPLNGYLGTFHPDTMSGGSYTYTIVNPGLHCPDTVVNVNIVLGAGPIIDLGADTNICVGDVLTLDASSNNASYTWSTGASQPTINVNQTGTYWVAASDSCAVTSDTILVTVNPYPVFSLGADTTVCQDDTLTLDVSTPGGSYYWNTGSSDSAIQVINPGWYFATVTVNGCATNDTIQVSFQPSPSVNFGNDTTFCEGNGMLLQATNAGATYLWNNNTTNSILYANASGTYWVEVNLNNCLASDTIVINVNPLPLTLLSDSSLCEGDSLLLNVTQNNVTYQWDNGSTIGEQWVSTSGTYTVSITNDCGSITDQADITFTPIPVVSLGADTVLCNEDSIQLNAQFPNATYQWNTLQTSSQIWVTQPGNYAVTTTLNNCTTTDEIEIDYTLLPASPFNEDTTICASSPLVIEVDPTLATYNWSQNGTNAGITISTAGVYFVTISNNNCNYSDSIEVNLNDCDVLVEMPNIFTPNDDGQNDVFAPIVANGLSNATLNIFNRWGQLITTRNYPNLVWNGKDDNNQLLPAGVYFWTMEYSGTLSQEMQQVSGNVSLVK